MGWRCAILRQLVGIWQIQDGCRDPGKFQNVFMFTLQYARDIILVYEEFNGTISNDVRLCITTRDAMFSTDLA